MDIKLPLFDQLENYYLERFAQDPILSIRKQAWNQLLKLNRKNSPSLIYDQLPMEEISQSFLTPLEEKETINLIEDELIPECRNSYLLFINGKLIPEWSKIPEGMVIQPIARAIRSYRSFLEERWKRELQKENDLLGLLNLTLDREGLFCYIPPQLSSTVQLLFYHQGEKLFHPARIHLYLGEKSRINWIISPIGAHIHQFSFDFALEKGAEINYIHYRGKGWSIEDSQITLKEESKCNYVTIDIGQAYRRVHAYLLGKSASLNIQGLWHLKEEEKFCFHSKVVHQASATYSNQKLKGILSDSAQSHFEGTIQVASKADKSEAYQSSRHLLLGEKVLAKTEPKLEIYTDDVRASHGATSSQIQQAELFYLRSRGIEQEKAIQLLLYGFMAEIVDSISIPSLKAKIEQDVISPI